MLEREEIYQRVWGYAMARGDRSVDVFVRKLRQKLEKASPDWRYIHTHFGVGYRFSPEPVEGSAAAAAVEAARRDGAGRGRRARWLRGRPGEPRGRAGMPAAPRGRQPRRGSSRFTGPPRAGRRAGGAPRLRRARTLWRVSTATMRNIAIILVLAAAVAFVPGGGDAANLIGALLSTAILACLRDARGAVLPREPHGRPRPCRTAGARSSTARSASSCWRWRRGRGSSRPAAGCSCGWRRSPGRDTRCTASGGSTASTRRRRRVTETSHIRRRIGTDRPSAVTAPRAHRGPVPGAP